MDVVITSIVAIEARYVHADVSRGRYRVTLRADDREWTLSYTVALSPSEQSVSWTPSDSVLADPRVDVLVVARVTDMVVAFHRGETIAVPK